MFFYKKQFFTTNLTYISIFLKIFLALKYFKIQTNVIILNEKLFISLLPLF